MADSKSQRNGRGSIDSGTRDDWQKEAEIRVLKALKRAEKRDVVPITVVGAGLTGSMIALLLAKRGLDVRVIEMRPDTREPPVDPQNPWAGVMTSSPLGQLGNVKARSINLALSHRGISALKRAGIFEKVMSSLIPMEGRAVHDKQGHVQFQPYGIYHQAIYSVSRKDLNDLLLNELDKHPNVELMFMKKVTRIAKDGTLTVVHGPGDTKETLPSLFTIGADGAFSGVRSAMSRLVRMDLSQQFITHAYKELTIPPNAAGDFALPNHQALHIWPRHEFMLIGLPNPDKSFTCTLFAPWKDLDAITTKEQALKYFQDNFPDVIPLLPNLTGEFFGNPTSALVTIRVDPWNYQDKVVLMGDAAHACVPFYGQGMNAGFEDCVVFDEIWDQVGGDYTKAVLEFNRVRQPIGNALADLSLGNYVEMRSKTAQPWWVAKRQIELLLYRLFPNTWIPQYNMVAFTRIPYHEAKARAEKQDRILGLGLATFCVGLAIGAVKLAHVYWPANWQSPADWIRARL